MSPGFTLCQNALKSPQSLVAYIFKLNYSKHNILPFNNIINIQGQYHYESVNSQHR